MQKITDNKKTTKIFALCGLIICSLLILFAFTGRYFGGFMHSLGNFFLGTFGISFYGLMAGGIVACSFILAGKKVVVPLPYVINFVFMFVVVVMLVHTYSTVFLSDYSFADYADIVFHYYDKLPTFGGVVWGCIAFAFQKVLTIWGASIVLWAALAVTAFFAGKFFVDYNSGKLKLNEVSESSDSGETVRDEDEVPSAFTRNATIDTTPMRSEAYTLLFEDRKESILDEAPNPIIKQGLYENYSNNGADPNSSVGNDNTFKTSVKKEKEKQTSVNSVFDDDFIVKTNSGSSDNDAGEVKKENIRTQPKSVETVFFSDSYSGGATDNEPQYQPPVQEVKSSFNDTSVNTVEEKPFEPQQIFTSRTVDDNKQEEFFVQPAVEHVAKDATSQDDGYSDIQQNNDAVQQPFYTSTVPQEDTVAEQTETQNQLTEEPKQRYTVKEVQTPVQGSVQMGFDIVEEKQTEEKPVHHYIEYEKPPLDLLNQSSDSGNLDEDFLTKASQAIVNKLSVFGIQVEAQEPIVGPSVTRFRFLPVSQKTQMKEFAKYDADLKSCLEAEGDIRIEAPIPGTNLVGIEVANKKKSPVLLRTVLESDAFKNAKGNLIFAVGQEITGKMVVADLSEKPHLLIAGATGSGKSVCLNCLIVSMMYRYSPEYLRFLMVDPKLVELSRYNGSPHLLTSEAITTVQDALAGMDYLINEMEARYQLFKETRVDNIVSYNKHIDPKKTQKMPYIVFVVDELADLMSTSKKAVESKILRLAQKSRAAGIHLVLATQRPSKDIITGTIKANLPCRMALKVTSYPDSSVIIGSGGAEKLLGYGDMLFVDPHSPGMTRLQGPYISNDEIRALVEFNKSQNEVYYEESVAKQIFASMHEEEVVEAEPASTEKENVVDPYCRKALRYWIEKNGGFASMSSLQRGLSVGFNRAGKIMETLANKGYIETLEASESNTKKRRVFVTLEQLDDIFPDLED